MSIDTINYCCSVIKESKIGFARWRAMLKILEENNYINFFSSKEKTRQKILECIDDIFEYLNTKNEKYQYRIWIQPSSHNNNEADEKYCELIRFCGCDIIEDGETILKSDIIILYNDDCIQYPIYCTYENINRFCNFIEGAIESLYDEMTYLYGNVQKSIINEEINQKIDYYWDFIDYDYNTKEMI